jgi:hypothetical protein
MSVSQMNIECFPGARARHLLIRESVFIAALTLVAALARQPSAHARASGIVADSCEGCHGTGVDTPDLNALLIPPP